MFRVERQELLTSHLRLDHYLVPWDSEIFGQPVAQLDGLQLCSDDVDAAAADFSRYEGWRNEQQVSLEVAKLGAGQMRELAFLEARGFRWLEMQYRMLWQLGPELPSLDDGLTVGPLRQQDREQVEELAATAFDASRFALDPHIGAELAGRRYRRWLANALASESQDVLVAHGDAGELVGFFIVEQKDQSGYWHLTAINPTQQGRGYGLRLWRHMMAWQLERGVHRIETSVSAHNLRVLGLYGRLGFRFVQAMIGLHRGGLLRKAGACAA